MMATTAASQNPSLAPAVDARQVARAYGRLWALRGLDLRIPLGASVALLGPNGAGKTTLIKLLASLERPSSGTLRVGGYELPRQAMDVRAFVGLVTHQTLVYDELTVRENLLFYAHLYAVSEPDERVAWLLDQVGLRARQHDRARTLSRGMQQRLSLARAIVHDPAILLLDEPETGLDVSAMDMIGRLFSAASNQRRTVVMATHSIERATTLCERVLVLHRGRLVFDSPSAATSPEELRRLLGKLADASAEAPVTIEPREMPRMVPSTGSERR